MWAMSLRERLFPFSCFSINKKTEQHTAVCGVYSAEIVCAFFLVVVCDSSLERWYVLSRPIVNFSLSVIILPTRSALVGNRRIVMSINFLLSNTSTISSHLFV